MAQHRKSEYSKFIVALCIVTVIAYTVTCFWFLWNGKPINDILTGFFFACFGMEFASLAFIKRGKLKYTGAGKVGYAQKQDDKEEQNE